jgi:hypothetical protein
MDTPLEYQFDSTDPTIQLIPPTIYFLKDVFNRMIVWMDVKAERPSWAYEMAAIERAIKKKRSSKKELKFKRSSKNNKIPR